MWGYCNWNIKKITEKITSAVWNQNCLFHITAGYYVLIFKGIYTQNAENLTEV